MLTAQRNELITRTGPGTPGGDLMRRYWHPVALSDELRADEPLPVRILGEDLVLFRLGTGAPALLGRRCPHRCVDLSYARVEEEGLRCIYHGWLISGDGRCLDQPTEPSTSRAKTRIRHTSYPCFEGNGLVLAYMGPLPAPPVPAFPFLAAPRDHVWVTRGLIECNYLQGNEGNLDPQHLGFLHRIIDHSVAMNPNYNALLIRQTEPPKMEIEETPFGFRLYTSRAASPGMKHVRVSNFIMPNCSSFEGFPPVDPKSELSLENIATQFHWHVPIDDENHWKYFVIHRYDGAVDGNYVGQFFTDTTEDPTSRNLRNHYHQNREEMKRRTFAGLGLSFAAHDKCVVEVQGKIMNRSAEHLSSSDRPVALMRQQLLQAIEVLGFGREPRGAARGRQEDVLAEMGTIASIVPDETDVLSGWWSAQNRELRAKAPYLDATGPLQ